MVWRGKTLPQQSNIFVFQTHARWFLSAACSQIYRDWKASFTWLIRHLLATAGTAEKDHPACTIQMTVLKIKPEHLDHNTQAITEVNRSACKQWNGFTLNTWVLYFGSSLLLWKLCYLYSEVKDGCKKLCLIGFAYSARLTLYMLMGTAEQVPDSSRNTSIDCYFYRGDCNGFLFIAQSVWRLHAE